MLSRPRPDLKPGQRGALVGWFADQGRAVPAVFDDSELPKEWRWWLEPAEQPHPGDGVQLSLI